MCWAKPSYFGSFLCASNENLPETKRRCSAELVRNVCDNSKHVFARCPTIGLANIIANQKALIANFLDNVKYVVSLPADEDDVVNAHVIRCHRNDRHQLATLDAPPHRTAVRTHLCRFTSTKSGDSVFDPAHGDNSDGRVADMRLDHSACLRFSTSVISGSVLLSRIDGRFPDSQIRRYADELTTQDQCQGSQVCTLLQPTVTEKNKPVSYVDS